MWGPAEWIAAAMLALAGVWILSKILGAILAVVAPPLARAFHYFFDLQAGDADEGTIAPADTEPNEPEPVRPLLYQVQNDTPKENVPPDELPYRHNLRRDELIVLLAVQKDEAGRYIYSANKIADFIGGTRAEVLTLIAAIRVKPPTPKPAPHLKRPANGW